MTVNSDLCSVLVFGAPYNNSEILIDVNNNLDCTVGRIKKIAVEAFGVPSDKLKLMGAGRFLENAEELLPTGILKFNLILNRGQSETPLKKGEEELFIDEMISFLNDYKGDDLFRDFFEKYNNCLKTYEKIISTHREVRIAVNKNAITNQLNELNFKEADRNSLVEFLKNQLRFLDKTFDFTELYRVYSDRILTDLKQNCVNERKILTALDESQVFQREISRKNKERVEFLKEELNQDCFTLDPTKIHLYADKRAENKQLATLRVLSVKSKEALSLIRQVVEDQKHYLGDTLLRLQLMVFEGHTTCLDLKIKGDSKSCVILDSISNISSSLAIMFDEMIRDGFVIYLPCSTIPNTKMYDIEILENNFSKIGEALSFFISHEERTSCYLRLFKIEQEWHLCSDGKITKIVDRNLLQTLDKSVVSDEELLDALLKSNLKFPFHPIEMQKDQSSCEYFSLHFAIRAAKTFDLHERCNTLSEECENDPLIIRKRLAKDIFTSINLLPWHKLDPKFIKWSQSETFLGSPVKRQPNGKPLKIFQEMVRKMKKRNLQVGIQLETNAQRIRRFVLESQQNLSSQVTSSDIESLVITESA